MNHLEIEVKFFVPDLLPIQIRLQGLGAKLLRSRVHELNLRFDNSTGDLARFHHVLRLRCSDDIRLTYKGPADIRAGVTEREEIEFTVGDFDAAWKLLESLGFQVAVIYEKFRTTYSLENAEIFFDETPIGNFIEIEAASPDEIRQIAEGIGLDWKSRNPRSYLALFELLRAKMGFSFRDMKFENFSDLHIPDNWIR